jgi:hypothetical protein
MAGASGGAFLIQLEALQRSVFHDASYCLKYCVCALWAAAAAACEEALSECG